MKIAKKNTEPIIAKTTQDHTEVKGYQENHKRWWHNDIKQWTGEYYLQLQLNNIAIDRGYWRIRTRGWSLSPSVIEDGQWMNEWMNEWIAGFCRLSCTLNRGISSFTITVTASKTTLRNRIHPLPLSVFCSTGRSTTTDSVVRQQHNATSYFHLPPTACTLHRVHRKK